MLSAGLEVSLGVFFLISAVQLLLGGASGWFLRETRVVPKADDDGEAQQLHARRMNEALMELRDLTGNIGQNVGQHAGQLEAIGLELAEARERGETDMDAALISAMAKVTEANERLQQQLQSAEQKIAEQKGQIETQTAEARTDALTLLPNRRAFDAELLRRLAEYTRYQIPVTLMLADVDHFKKFNDTHGHLAGDEVLRGVAKTLFQAMREVDLVARYGGEEFAVIFPATTVQDAQRGAERGRAAIEAARFEFEGTTLAVTISGGLAEATKQDDSASLIKRADEALYAAKKGGRNQVQVQTDEGCQPLKPKHAEPAAAPVAAMPTPVVASPPMPLPDAKLKYDGEEHALVTPTVNSRTDELTGLPNFFALREELSRQIAERRRRQTPVCVAMVQVDQLSELQAEHGPQVTEVILRAVTQFLKAALRSMDFVARRDDGGFALVLPATTVTNSVHVAERIRKAVELCRLRIEEQEFQFSVSVGVAEVLGADDVDGVLARGDATLIAAQSVGGNSTRYTDAANPQPVAAIVTAEV